MASIPICRQDYGSSEFNGWEPNTPINGFTPQAMASGSNYTIEGDFKDHKTLFTFISTNTGDTTVTFKAGDSFQGVKDLVVTVPSGTTHIWLDSAKFADKETGEIIVTTSAAGSLTAYGVEMR